jgi:dienelactone hydrolase
MWVFPLALGCSPPASDPKHSPDPVCAEPGCLRSATSFGVYDRAAITPWLAPGVTLDNGYEVVAIEYVTESGTATATVTLPLDLAGAGPVDGFPVVANAHGTVGLEDPCQLTGTSSGTGLAALFGGRGAIGVAPDYPGLGTPGAHRYLDARSEATSVLDSLRAAMHLAADRGVPTSGRAAVVGLSQGGHASLAAAALHSRYAPELDVRAFAASGPASLYEEQWRAGVSIPGPHLSLHAMMAWSFTEVSGEDRAGVWASGEGERLEAALTTRCYWSPTFTSEPLLGDGFPTRAEDVFSPAFLAEYASGDWARFPWMAARFDDNRLVPWLGDGEQTAPVAIWQGTADTTVLAADTAALVEDLAAGGIDVTLHLVEGGTHTTTAFGFLAYPEAATDESVAWVQGLLAEP